MARKNVENFEQSAQTYFKEIGAYAPLSKEEDFSLWEQYKKNHDLAARDKIIQSNLRFVASVAKNFIGQGLSYADLVAEGNCGLMKAMDKFDYRMGNKTISYAVWWIRQSIIDALKNRNGMDTEELPTEHEKQSEDGNEIDDEPFMESPEIFLETNRTDSMDNLEARKLTNELIACLTDREQEVLNMYFGLNSNDEMTLDEIGERLNLTKERVRQIKEKALRKLRCEALNNNLTRKDI